MTDRFARVKEVEPVLLVNWAGWLPADPEDLVVVPLTRDFEKFLGSIQSFFEIHAFAFAVKLSRLEVVLHS